jgi:hypothetical protein
MSRLPAYSEHIISNDRDALNLYYLLVARTANPPEANRIVVHLQGTTKFTEKGARKVVKCILALDERPSVHVMVASSMLDFAFVTKIVKILYLKANKPELYVFDAHDDLRRREEFDHDCRMLQQNQAHLKEYSFGSLRSKAVSIQFGISLQGNTELQTLSLGIDGDLSPDIARALAAGICNSAVTNLIIRTMYLSSTGIAGDGLRTLWIEGIRASGRILKSLELIAIRGRELNTSGLAKTISCVKYFALKGTSMGLPEDKSYFQSLCERVEHSSNLLGLTLQECGLDDDAMTMLAIGLRNHRTMRKLDLFHNSIGDAGIAALVENWPADSRLELLNLGQNSIGLDGLQQLMTTLANRHALKTLILENNSFGCYRVQIIGNHLPDLRLREMVLGHFYIFGDESMTRVLHALHSWLRAIKPSYFLQCLDLSWPHPLELTHEINFYVKLNERGRYLLVANDVPPALWCLIFAKCRTEGDYYCECSSSILFYFLLEQPHLVREHRRSKRRPPQPTLARRNDIAGKKENVVSVMT